MKTVKIRHLIRSHFNMTLLGFFLFLSSGLVAQNLSVNGSVVTESGEPLPGVNILLKGTNNGTQTDFDGNYSLSNVAPDATLSASYIGFKTLEIKVNGQSAINFILVEDTEALDEVVVIGYGSVKKSDLTGAVSSIGQDDFNSGINTSVEQLIQGKVAGANIISGGGEPGTGFSISIRGASSVNAGTQPLYVIDGLPVDNSNAVSGTGSGIPATRSPRNPLNGLNTSDIASIEILKDASATAIYGARGANGVVLISTKKGTAGKTKVAYETYYGYQNAANSLDMLTPREYQQVVNDIIDDGGGSVEQRVNQIINGGTNWQKQVQQTNALIRNHNLSFSGGTESTRYFTSFSYLGQEGGIKSSEFERYSVRLNLDNKISDKFTTGINFTAGYTKDDYVPSGFAINEFGGALYSAINYDPSLPVRDDNGEFFISPDLTIENPLALVNGVDSYANTYSFLGTAFAEYQINTNLSTKITVGGNSVSERRDTYVDRTTQLGRANEGIATILNGQKNNYLIELSTNYKKELENHRFDVFLGATTQKFNTVRSSESARGFSSDVTGTDNIGLGNQETYEIGSTRFTNKLISYIGRINYSLLDKYLLTASFRADGSSRFGENNKFGYFPSVAGAWKISEEAFLNESDFINTLKLRASWGRTGNQEISNYQSLSTFGAGSSASFGQQPIVSLSPNRIANPDLGWETTEQWDIGLDFGILGSRITGSVDYYKKRTYDLLLDLPIPISTGFNSILTNVGEVVNNGIDISLNSFNIATDDFSWSTNLNLATTNNKVTNLAGIPQIISGDAGFTNQIFIIEENQPLRSFYGWEIEGVWQEGDDFTVTDDNVAAGDLKYVDLNGDRTVNADDRKILGDGFPDYTYSISNDFRFKNISLSIFLEGVEGIQILNNNLVDSYFPVQLRRNKLAEPYLNRWTPENPSNIYPSFVNPSGQGRKAVNSYTVEDGSYIRLKTVRLDYTFPIKKTGFYEQIGVYVTGENLALWTNYSGIDPGVNSNGSSNTFIDNNTYPIPRTFIIGVKIDF